LRSSNRASQLTQAELILAETPRHPQTPTRTSLSSSFPPSFFSPARHVLSSPSFPISQAGARTPESSEALNRQAPPYPAPALNRQGRIWRSRSPHLEVGEVRVTASRGRGHRIRRSRSRSRSPHPEVAVAVSRVGVAGPPRSTPQETFAALYMHRDQFASLESHRRRRLAPAPPSTIEDRT
jgi:hypothetical protein